MTNTQDKTHNKLDHIQPLKPINPKQLHILTYPMINATTIYNMTAIILGGGQDKDNAQHTLSDMITATAATTSNKPNDTNYDGNK